MPITGSSSFNTGASGADSIKYKVSDAFSQEAQSKKSFGEIAWSAIKNFIKEIFLANDLSSNAEPGVYFSKDISDTFSEPVRSCFKDIADGVDALFVELMRGNPEGVNQAAGKINDKLFELGENYGHELPKGFDSKALVNAIFRDCVAALPRETLQQLMAMDDGQWASYDNLAMSVILNQVLERVNGSDSAVNLSPEGKIVLNTRVASYASPFQSSELKGKDLENVGSGLSHSVGKGDYALGLKDGETTVKVFKEMENKVPEQAKHFIGLLGLVGPNSNPRYAERNVAASLLADKMGFPVIVRTDLAMHQGKRGIVMEYCTAPTKDLSGENKFNVCSFNDIKFKEAHKADYAKLKQDPQFNHDLSALQLLDYLSGQFDRHGENFLVLFETTAEGPQYKGLKGIDNDGCFGSEITPSYQAEMNGEIMTDSHSWNGMPAVIDEGMANAVNNLSANDLKAIGNNRLTDAEINAACIRLDQLKTAIQDQKITIIKAESWGIEDSGTKSKLAKDAIYYKKS